MTLSDMDIAINASKISKKYHLYNHHFDRLKEALHPFRKKYHHDFYALRNVSFDIKKGETVGIIGKNGAGKSTLLKILTGVLSQSDGSISTCGKFFSILELGIGFNPELTGLENIEFYGMIVGHSKEELKEKLKQIIDFSQLGEFIEQPIKTYSSGMQMRLAFAIAIHSDADILIIDEAFAVGDVRFQQKCYRKIKELQGKGKTILLVTHDTGAVINHCSRAMWLDNGELVEDGNPAEVCKKYLVHMFHESEIKITGASKNDEYKPLSPKFSEFMLADTTNRESFGEGGVTILGNGLFLKNTSEIASSLKGGETVSYVIKFQANRDINDPIIGFDLTDKYGNRITGLNNLLIDMQFQTIKSGDIGFAQFNFTMPRLMDGEYSFNCAVACGSLDSFIHQHLVYEAYSVKINSNNWHGRMGWYVLLHDAEISLDLP